MGTNCFRGPRQGFSLIEILVVTVILVVVTSILLTVVSMARGGAKKTQCMSNLRQVGVGYLNYSQDYSGMLAPFATFQWGIPYDHFWPCLIAPYADVVRLKDTHTHYEHELSMVQNSILTCPSVPPERFVFNPDAVTIGYGRNMQIINQIWTTWTTAIPGPAYAPLKIGRLSNAGQLLLLADAPFPGLWADIFTADPATDPIGTRHRASANYLFTDFHVQAIGYAEVLPANVNDVGTSRAFDSSWSLK
jgi:prepilin-type N-terminal cleavage/methylation domain-containing protein/prepilin-type processing-associated H-X9-DG protein